MTTKEILVIDNDCATRKAIIRSLVCAGFGVREAVSAQSTRIELALRHPDLLLVDWILPGISGIELIRSLKADRHTRGLATIIVTARVDDADKIEGLNSGADDYITKPFSAGEMIARIRAVLRRCVPERNEDAIRISGVILDAASQSVFVGERRMPISRFEFRLLEFFMTHPDKVYSRTQLIAHVWGRSALVDQRTVDVHIRRLRRTLQQGGCDHLVQTVHGAGYRFADRYDARA